MLKVKFSVHGRVQGVGFRSFVRKTALVSGLSGWVKNKYDGTVLAEVQGPDSLVKSFIEKIRQGSFFSRVDELEIEETLTITEEESDSFEIRF